MFFKLSDGKTYGIKFSREQLDTLAYWVEIGEDGKMYYTGEVGIASLDSRDRFVKSTGRKVALTNLLQWMSDPVIRVDFPGLLLSKEDRKIIWNAYFVHHRR